MPETVIVGTGPYGLSIAAHFNRLGIPYRIFGRPMDSWISHMPKGMLLKSDGFASTISDPVDDFTLERYCADVGTPYAAIGTPVKLETFSKFGLAFCERLVSNLEEKIITKVATHNDGFLIELEGGETLTAKRVILAVGITHFSHTPEVLAQLPHTFSTHSFNHADPEEFRGNKVAVVGAGSSAIDLAISLYDAGVDVQLIGRTDELIFHNKMQTDKARTLWQQFRSPLSGLGPGLSSRFFANFPNVVHSLPESYRLEKVRTFLGPAGGWFSKEKILGKVPLLLGSSIETAKIVDNQVELELQSKTGRQIVRVDHVVAATGYRADINRLDFLAPELRSKIKTTGRAPALSSTFESSMPDLYFTGLAAANSFGPVMRFAFGAPYTAKRLSKSIARVAARGRAWSAVPEVRTGQG
jgi:hypothetical protein